MTRPRKLYVKSFGCQMNVYDSHRMADTLAPEGFVETLNAGDADLVILNTCIFAKKRRRKCIPNSAASGRSRPLRHARDVG